MSVSEILDEGGNNTAGKTLVSVCTMTSAQLLNDTPARKYFRRMQIDYATCLGQLALSTSERHYPKEARDAAWGLLLLASVRCLEGGGRTTAQIMGVER